MSCPHFCLFLCVHSQTALCPSQTSAPVASRALCHCAPAVREAMHCCVPIKAAESQLRLNGRFVKWYFPRHRFLSGPRHTPGAQPSVFHSCFPGLPLSDLNHCCPTFHADTEPSLLTNPLSHLSLHSKLYKRVLSLFLFSLTTPTQISSFVSMCASRLEQL